MKRGHIILISGAVLLVAGIAVAAIWGISFASSFVRDNTIVAKATIPAGQSVSAKTDVAQLANSRPISLAIGIDKTGEQQQQQALPTSDLIRLRETVTDPNGKVVSSNEFGDSFLTSFKPQVAGVYTVTVTNLGTRPVSIGGTFGYMPFIDSNGRPDINAVLGGQGLGMIIAGGLMVVAGVITLIVGGIITAIDSRTNRGQTTTTSSEGGVTYRKD